MLKWDFYVWLGISGAIYIDEQGDKEVDFSILHVADPDTGAFQVQ